MCDTADDLGFHARQLLNKSKTHSLREQMRTFVVDHDSNTDLRELRKRASSGKPVSKLIEEDRL